MRSPEVDVLDPGSSIRSFQPKSPPELPVGWEEGGGTDLWEGEAGGAADGDKRAALVFHQADVSTTRPQKTLEPGRLVQMGGGGLRHS